LSQETFQRPKIDENNNIPEYNIQCMHKLNRSNQDFRFMTFFVKTFFLAFFLSF